MHPDQPETHNQSPAREPTLCVTVLPGPPGGAGKGGQGPLPRLGGVGGLAAEDQACAPTLNSHRVKPDDPFVLWGR